MKLELRHGGFALIDESDLHLIMPFNWFLSPTGYAMVFDGKRRKTLYMHRLILGAEKGQVVDHIDRNKLNNQRSNLRVASYLINRLNTGVPSNNTSGIKGVCWRPREQKWVAYFHRGGKHHRLGGFNFLEEAALCRQEAMQREFGGGYHGDQ